MAPTKKHRKYPGLEYKESMNAAVHQRGSIFGKHMVWCASAIMVCVQQPETELL